MTLRVHPDPQQPAGGYAFLELPEGQPAESPVTVAVFDAYGEKWLSADVEVTAAVQVGEANWQQDRFEFGPYQVYPHDGANWVRIGPEIVNKLEEYAPLRIWVAGEEFDVTWPDNVPPRAGAAVLGGIQPVARSRGQMSGPGLVGQVQEPEPEPPQVGGSGEEDEVATVAEDTDVSKDRSFLPLLVAMVLLIAVAAAIWWFWWDQPSDRLAKENPEIKETIPVANEPDSCELNTLKSLDGGFAKVGPALRDCGKSVSADATLNIIEDFAQRSDPDALLLFGTLYDGQELDARIENLIGLTFDPDDTRAAEYYARAVEAGSDRAEQLLSGVCQRLSGSNSTLAKGAHDDFCQ